MSAERTSDATRRAATYAALGDPARLRIVDILALGDASSSELARTLEMPSNLVAHHLKALREAGIVVSHRSQGDGRRAYLRLSEEALALAAPAATRPERVVFVCTANSARSHLAAALWQRASDIPAISAGTDPADEINHGAVEAAGRQGLDLPLVRPQNLDTVVSDSDLVVTVCDLAHESLKVDRELHWSIPDPVREGTPEAFDAVYDEIESRVSALASRLAS
jgi:ArsR family transcriptional regulator, arsenate/arsenite/antimonite-responsive transcriptional repressor / arsenate reductase (thioredoxin)